MPKVSIIIPVYNAENYLRETLNSVLNQTFTDFEVIALNDGSKDNSLSILNEYASKDGRFVVIDKPNSGVSDTRNLGILKASGEYIACLDADDLYSPNFLSVMLGAIESSGAEVAVCKYESFRGSANAIYSSYQNANDRQTSVQELLDNGLMTPLWLKLFKKKLLIERSIQFDKNMAFGEDVFFCWKACLVSNKIWFVDKVLYAYRLTGTSATSKYHDKLYEKYKFAFDDLKNFCLENNLEKEQNFKQINEFFTKRLPALSMMCARSKMKLKQKKEYIAKILEDKDIKGVLENDFDSLVKNAPKKTYDLYKNAKNQNATGVLRFGERLNFRIVLANLKSKIRGK